MNCRYSKRPPNNRFRRCQLLRNNANGSRFDYQTTQKLSDFKKKPHIAGIKEAGKVIAIDHNPRANIFHNADFGIVGEYTYIMPELIERVKAGFTSGIEAKKEL
jgi:hypothetical protein